MATGRTARRPTDFFGNIDSIFATLDHKFEKPVQKHLRNVYATLAVGLTSAAIGAVFSHVVGSSLLLLLGSIACMFALITTPHTAENLNRRIAYFFGFTFISGVGLGPLLDRVIAVDPSIVFTALVSTVIVFGCFTLSALYAPTTKFLHLGGTLASASLTLLLVAIFSSSPYMYSVILWGGLAINCLFILYDTQLIIEKRRRGDDDFVWHAVELFIDFIQVFRYLLVLLREKKRDERRRD